MVSPDTTFISSGGGDTASQKCGLGRKFCDQKAMRASNEVSGAKRAKVDPPNAGGGARRVASFALVWSVASLHVGGRDVSRLPRLCCRPENTTRSGSHQVVGSTRNRRAKRNPSSILTVNGSIGARTSMTRSGK